MQPFSVDRPGAGLRSHHWLPPSGSFLYGWLASRAEDPLSGIPAKIARFPPRKSLMIGRGYYGVNRSSYQCSQRGWLAAPAAGRLCDTELSINLQEAHVHVFERVRLYTIHTGRCAAKPCQRVLAPHYSRPGSGFERSCFQEVVPVSLPHTTVHHTGNISLGSSFAALCKLIWIFEFSFAFFHRVLLAEGC